MSILNSFRITPQTLWRVIAGGVFGIMICALALAPLVHYRRLSSIAKIIPAESAVVITVRPSGNPLLPTPISSLPLQQWWHTTDVWFNNSGINFYDDVVHRSKQITAGVWIDEANQRHVVVIAEFFSSRAAREFAEQHTHTKFISGSTVMIANDDVAYAAAGRSAGEPLTSSRVPSSSLHTDPISITVTPSHLVTTSLQPSVQTIADQSWSLTLNTKNIQSTFLSSSLFNLYSSTTTNSSLTPGLIFSNVSFSTLGAITGSLASEVTLLMSSLDGNRHVNDIQKEHTLTSSTRVTLLLFTSADKKVLDRYVVIMPYHGTSWSAEQFEKNIASSIAFRWPSSRTHVLPDNTTVQELVADDSIVKWRDERNVNNNDGRTLRMFEVGDHDFTFAYAVTPTMVVMGNDSQIVNQVSVQLAHEKKIAAPSCDAYDLGFGVQAGSVMIYPSALPTIWQSVLPDFPMMVKERSNTTASGCIFQ